MTEREKCLEDNLFSLYAREAAKRLSELRTKHCYGCTYDRPSQKDHDLCMAMHETDVDYYIDLAFSKVNGAKIIQYWHETLKNISPPLSGLEMLKYKSFEWFEETVQCHDGKESIKAIMLEKLKEEEF